MIPREVVSALLARVDLVELIERTVPLKKAGAVYKGLCPFHSERTSSFMVFGDHYHCFGCGAHGSAIGWMMAHGGMTFPDAVDALAQGATFDLGAAPPPQDHSRRLRAEAKQKRLQEHARIEAQELLAACDRQRHPYLCRKGFPTVLGLVHVESGDLIVPMRDLKDYETVNTVQRIDGDGEKKFLYGGQAKGSVLRLASGKTTWIVEGYATGLSVQAALKHLHQPAGVLIAFNADNIKFVASKIPRPAFVFADRDDSGVGQAAAEATGLHWCVAPALREKKTDANDLHMAKGIRAVADLMREAQDKAAGYIDKD